MSSEPQYRGFLALLADGSVRYIPTDTDENSLRMLFNPADGSDANVPQFD